MARAWEGEEIGCAVALARLADGGAGVAFGAVAEKAWMLSRRFGSRRVGTSSKLRKLCCCEASFSRLEVLPIAGDCPACGFCEVEEEGLFPISAFPTKLHCAQFCSLQPVRPIALHRLQDVCHKVARDGCRGKAREARKLWQLTTDWTLDKEGSSVQLDFESQCI